MATNRNQHGSEIRARQTWNDAYTCPNRIRISTGYDFCAGKLMLCGGLLPVATMLVKIVFEDIVNETVTMERTTKAISM
jgi:hypothetical protein